MSVESTTEKNCLVRMKKCSYFKTKNWQDVEIRVLLKLWKKNYKLVKVSNNGVKTRKSLQSSISKALCNSGTNRSVTEVSHKMRNCLSIFRDEEENVMNTDQPSKWRYYNDMKEIIDLENNYSIAVQSGKEISPTTVPEIDLSAKLLQDLIASSSTGDDQEFDANVFENAHMVKIQLPGKSKDCRETLAQREDTGSGPVIQQNDFIDDSNQYADESTHSMTDHGSDSEPAYDSDHVPTGSGIELRHHSHQSGMFRGRSDVIRSQRRKRSQQDLLEEFLSEFRRSNREMEKHDRALLQLMEENNEICKKQNRLLSLFYTKYASSDSAESFRACRNIPYLSGAQNLRGYHTCESRSNFPLPKPVVALDPTKGEIVPRIAQTVASVADRE